MIKISIHVFFHSYTKFTIFFINKTNKNCKNCIILSKVYFEKLVPMFDTIPVVPLVWNKENKHRLINMKVPVARTTGKTISKFKKMEALDACVSILSYLLHLWIRSRKKFFQYDFTLDTLIFKITFDRQIVWN